jgi:hypothetical protein
MLGASLLYNLLLAERAEAPDAVSTYRERLSEWSEGLSGLLPRLALWDMERFWFIARSRAARIPPATQLFVRDWARLVLALPTPGAVADAPVSREMIRSREWHIKRNQARLFSAKTLGLWSGAAGASQLSFRWPVARQLVADIVAGLSAEGSDA